MIGSHNTAVKRSADINSVAGVCRVAHWRATWTAVIKASRLEDPEEARAFLSAYTNGRFEDIDAALSGMMEREASALVRFTNNTLVSERAARTEARPRQSSAPRGGRTYQELFGDDSDEFASGEKTLTEAHTAPSHEGDASEGGAVDSGPRWQRTEPLARPEEAEEYDRAQLESFYIAWSARLRVLDVMRRPAWSHTLADAEMRRDLFLIRDEVESLEDFLARFDTPEAT